MKKLLILSFAVLFVLPLTTVYAASIGGVETQGQGKIAIGLDQGFVFDRDLKVEERAYYTDPGDNMAEGNTEVNKMYQSLVKVGYGITDNLDAYVKLGTADLETELKYKGTYSTGYDIGTTKWETDNAFAYGAGLKAKYEFEGGWILGGDVQYIRHKHDTEIQDSYTEYNNAGNVTGSDSTELKGKLTFQEWHIAPFIARKINNFTPYVGVKYSDARIKARDDWEDGAVNWKFEADDNVGVFVGTEYKIGDNWKLNLEGRFIDETAMSFGATYKF